MDKQQKVTPTLSEERHSYCLFQTPWWLDATAAGQWEEVVLESAGEVIGRFPFVRKQRLGLTYFTQPRLTKMLGPWVKPYEGRQAGRCAYEKEILWELIDKLPNFSYMHQDFHYCLNNWQPFFWRGFQQTTYYTFVINDISDPAKVFQGFNSGKKSDIKRAQKIVEVREDQSSGDFYRQYQNNLTKQGKTISYEFDLFDRICSAAYKQAAGKIFYAVDAQENVHASLLVVWDSRSAFYLVNSIDPDFRKSGAASLLTWSAINYLSDRTRAFDFEGSMIQGVADSYRAFGAEPMPYSFISKSNSRLVDWAMTLRKLIRR